MKHFSISNSESPIFSLLHWFIITDNITYLYTKKTIHVWKQRKLKEFGQATGGTSIESEFIEGGKYKVISIGSYSEQSVYKDQNIRVELTDKTRSRVLNKDDLTMILNDKTTSGNIIGRVLLIESDDSYVYNQRTERIEPDHKKYDSQFLYQMFNAPIIRSKIIKKAQGNTQIYVNWSAISELDYLIPKLVEQSQIGLFFKYLDNCITLHQRKLAQLEKLKQALLQQMFPQKDAVVPKLRFAIYADDWEQCKLGSIYDFSKGKGLPLNSFTYSKDDPAIAYGHLYTKYSEVISEVYLSSNDQGVLSKDNDLLFPGSSTVPNGTAQANAITLNNIKLGGDIIIGRPKQNVLVSSIFMSYQINSQRQKLFPITVGTTITHMYGKDLSKIKFSITSYSEQEKISEFFKQLDNMITLHQEKLEHLNLIKQSLLQNMFT
ncbi:restriction endonuclease subunit S [Aerococcus urinaeequi]